MQMLLTVKCEVDSSSLGVCSLFGAISHSFQVYQLALRHALVRRHYGRALKMMMKQAEEKPGKDLDVEMIEVNHIAIQQHAAY
jgi:hypothetical protein